MRRLQFSYSFVLEMSQIGDVKIDSITLVKLISRKFSEVIESLMIMTKHFIVPKDANFHTTHKRITDDRRA
jgi:hypothetical protein